jgi:hypothetical protein
MAQPIVMHKCITGNLAFFGTIEQAFPNFVPGKNSLLVLDARDLRCLDQFGVEADKFLGVGSHRSQGAELVHNRNRGIDAMLERWWQPALFLASAVEARSAVAQVGTSGAGGETPPFASVSC